MGQVYDLGGRYFAPAQETSARQDGWVLVQCKDAGVMEYVGRALDTEATALDLIIQVLRSGKREHILAGVLVEHGARWSVESAEQNAEYFAALTDPAAKQTLSELFIPALAGFFLAGAASSTVSPSASVATAPVVAQNSPEPPSTEIAAPDLVASGAV